VHLNFVAMEERVLLALGAVRALEAGDKQYGYAHRDQHGKNASIHRNPMCQGPHLSITIQGKDPAIRLDSETLWNVTHIRD
jgi:hypothetical protein